MAANLFDQKQQTASDFFQGPFVCGIKNLSIFTKTLYKPKEL